MGAKIDGYAGPFDTYTTAAKFQEKYNLTFNNETRTPSYYIKALSPCPYTDQKCLYGPFV